MHDYHDLGNLQMKLDQLRNLYPLVMTNIAIENGHL